MSELIQVASDIVASYVAHNSLPVAEVSELIGQVHARLDAIQNPATEPEQTKPVPAVAVGKSIQADHIVCLFCGGKFQSLKRHLMVSHNTTPAAYRVDFELPRDYPMVPADFREKRSAIARANDLGSSRKKDRPEPAPDIAAVLESEPGAVTQSEAA